MSEPKFAILRTQKLKDLASIRRSLKHSFREQTTLNADSNREHLNSHYGANSAAQAQESLKKLLPEKRRKDAVLAIEYLITASPEAMKNKSKCEQDKYFADSIKWLNQRHGKENVVYAGIHRDETTPHLYAYAVPIDRETGRLNAKKWLGGAKALNEMQTEFALKVGKVHGLERGIEGSKSKHQTIKKFYGELEKNVNSEVSISSKDLEPKVLDKGMFSKTFETKEQVAKRISRSLSDRFSEIATKATVSASNKKKCETYGEALIIQRKMIEELKKPFNGITRHQMKRVLDTVEKFQIINAQESVQGRSNASEQSKDDYDR